MRKVELNQALTVKLSEHQRLIIEELADRRNTTLGEAARMLISSGIETLGMV